MNKSPIVLLGGQNARSTFSQVNRNLIVSFEKAGLSIGLDPEQINKKSIVIHHDYLEFFNKIRIPECAVFCAFRTWDFGPYPPKWTELINHKMDQLWVYSQWTKAKAIESGVQESKVKVIPLGYDPSVYKHDGPIFALKTQKAFRFIFTGAAIQRKGMDILLKAYESAFTRTDDVCLVIKDHTKDVFYESLSFKDRILEMTNDVNHPEIEYIDSYLNHDELTGLDRACNVGVFPYRAEGFALPILEMMACGVPCIVPNFGACLDYCNEQNAILVPVSRIALPITKEFAFNTLGFKVEVDHVDFCEVDPEKLAKQMRAVFENQGLVKEKKKNTSSTVSSFTWDNTVRSILEHLDIK